MQYLQLKKSVLLVVIAVVGFQVEGFPSDNVLKKNAYGHWWELGLPNPRYSELLQQEQVFSAITYRSLWKIFGFYNHVDILDTLAQVLVGISRQPPNGEIDYMLGRFFLNELEEIAPRFLKDVKIVAYMIMAEKRLLADNQRIDYDFLFRHATAKYYGFDKSGKLMDKFSSIVPWIFEAMKGTLEAAKYIVKRLAGYHNKEVEYLRRIDRKKVVGKVLEKVQWYLNTELKRCIAEAKQSKTT